MEWNYSICKPMVLDALARCITLHEAGQYQEMSDVYDSLDQDLPRGRGPRAYKIWIAVNFLDGWVDSSNHYWSLYDDIDRDDWPHLAKLLIDDIEAERDVTNEILIKHFDFRGRTHSLVVELLGKILVGLIFLIF